jgi:hypothetical protein
MKHECKRYKTVLKINRVRMTVACRECGKIKHLHIYGVIKHYIAG